MVSKREAMNLNRGDSLLMPRKTFRLPLSVISLLLLGQAGCAAKKTITSTYPPFRLQVVDNASLLLTPSVPKDSPNDAPILVKGIAKTRSNAPADTCTLEQGPFRLEPDLAEKNTLMITLPPREEWLARLEGQSDADDRTVFDLLDTFLTKLDQLRSSGCLEESVDALRGSILQSIPTKPEQGLLNAYDYRGGRSSIDLKPDIRLKIERAYFEGEESIEVQSAAKNFKGLSWFYFDVKSDAAGRISFERIGAIKFSPASLAHTDEEGKRDLALGSLGPQSCYHLFFYSYLVPTHRKRSATIIGGASEGQLDAVETKLRANPEQGCEEAAAGSAISCFEFQGLVTVSAEISVSVNGKLDFLEWGAKVRNVLPDSTSLQSLRIQRKFNDGYADLIFDPKRDDILSLVLVGGDRLTTSTL
jgi:hypothetical protein